MRRWTGIVSIGLVLLFLSRPVMAQIEPARIYTGAPFDVQGAINFISWSPYGEAAAYWVYREIQPDIRDEGSRGYFLPGELWFLIPETGETCLYSGPYRSSVDWNYLPAYYNPVTNTWLPDGRIAVLQKGGLVASTPCGDDFLRLTLPDGTPVRASSLDSWSPDYNRLLLDEGAAIYTLNPPSLVRVTGFERDSYGDWAWSPDSRHVAVSLSGPGSTYLIDAQTGQVRLLVEEPIPPPDFGLGIFPHTPLWLGNNRLIVDSTTWGAVLTDLDGVQIDLGAERTPRDTHLGALVAGTDTYHLVVKGPSTQAERFLFHSEDESLETLPLNFLPQAFSPDGNWLMGTGNNGSGIYLRPVDPAGGEPVEVVAPMLAGNVANPNRVQWSPDWSKVALTNEDGVSIVSLPDGEIVQTWAHDTCDDYRLDGWSPDGTLLLLRLYGDAWSNLGAAVVIEVK
jgi:hypothetical protein